MPEFKAWPKITRLNRRVVITEKIDGTNAAIIVDDDGSVHAQSRKRLITPGKQTDNYGFAGWVAEHADQFREALGPGHHYGEWYGQGIQHGYGLDHKRFALFNIVRYADVVLSGALPANVDVVPTLARLEYFDSGQINEIVRILREEGSQAVPGAKAEGVVVFHEPSQHVYKVLCHGDEVPKGLVSSDA